MKNKKIALFLVGILSIITMLASCSSKSSENDTDDKKITIMAPLLISDVPTKNNEIDKKLKELTGYDVDITWVPNSSYADKVSITLASNDVPDIMIVTDKDAATISNVKKGTFWKLDNYLKDYDNLSKSDEEIKLNASFNGETYGIYRKRDVIRSCVIFRKDWLDKLGLKVPSTLDEFTNVLEKFTNDDPDGNGVNDTTGMVIPKWTGGLNTNSPFDQMAVWFGAPNGTTIKDGKVVLDFMTDEYIKSLDYFKKLYDEGFMNKDFAVLDSGKWDDSFVNGKAGVIVDTQSRAMNRLAKKTVEKYGDDGQNGDSYVTMIGDIATDAGNYILPTTGYSGMFMIPKQSVKDEKNLKKVLDFINKTNTEEVTTLLNHGVEGVHYEIKDEKIESTTDQKLLNEKTAYSQLSTNVLGYDIEAKNQKKGSKLEEINTNIMETGKKKAVFNPCASLISDVYSKKGVQLQNIMSDARIQYIAGQIDKDGYKSAQKQWLKTGGQEYIDELTELYNKNLK
ncbi:extracellular solute-binding protein [Clostridium sp. SHJSY1]|uniref:extracellular solute-binding protein n=1 Tax=Clostridium sp. SHJSY1 TaxID=2942483 RepID=UPI002875AFD4|nr:extracellular solute-binding protein [Clostridium sp. SHJSY1]MDS0527030.1 extracellular solute-binding protein [Clostridium sp. SHJSY1]